MNTEKKNILIVAPFYNSNNVGVYRIERFIKWLKSEYTITVISSGIKSKVVDYDWGKNIVIKDGFTSVLSFFLKREFLKPFYLLINFFSYYFVIPDQYIFFAKKISHQIIEEISKVKYEFILSSSPQNSSHIAAYNLAKKLNIPLITDFRDGWIDEPLRKITEQWKWRNKIERKMEGKIVDYSKIIFVSSPKWKELMSSRYKNSAKITVLTNAYPSFVFSDIYKNNKAIKNSKKTIKIIYTGNFTVFRKVNLLLEPVFSYCSKTNKKVEFTLMGKFRKKDHLELKHWKQLAKNTNLKIIVKKFIPRKEMFEELFKNDGLVLLSASYGAIPSKIFEFIPLRKPILAITQKNGAVWDLSKNIPQVFLFDYLFDNKNYESLSKFFEACENPESISYSVPKEYSEDYLGEIFIKKIKSINN